MALKRAPICGRNVCLSFFLRIYTSKSDIFNQIKKDETDPTLRKNPGHSDVIYVVENVLNYFL